MQIRWWYSYYDFLLYYGQWSLWPLVWTLSSYHSKPNLLKEVFYEVSITKQSIHFRQWLCDGMDPAQIGRTSPNDHKLQWYLCYIESSVVPSSWVAGLAPGPLFSEESRRCVPKEGTYWSKGPRGFSWDVFREREGRDSNSCIIYESVRWVLAQKVVWFYTKIHPTFCTLTHLEPLIQICFVYFTLLVIYNDWQSSVARFIWSSAPPLPPLCWTCVLGIFSLHSIEMTRT